MAQKALTSKGSQCSDCSTILAVEDRFCPQCAAALTGSFQAVVCPTCGSFAEASRIRCPSCRGELVQVESDDVEEEDLRVIPSLPLAAQVGLALGGDVSSGAPREEPLRDMRLSLQAAAALCYTAIQATLREDLLWKAQAVSRGRQEELRKALRTAGETLHDVRRLLSSPAGLQAVMDDVRRAELSRLRDREARLMRENEDLRKALATREVLMLISEDELVSRMGEELRTETVAQAGTLEMQAISRLLDAVGALLSRLPPEVLGELEATPEHVAFERLARLHASASAPPVKPGRSDARSDLVRGEPGLAIGPFRRQPA